MTWINLATIAVAAYVAFSIIGLVVFFVFAGTILRAFRRMWDEPSPVDKFFGEKK